MFQLHSKKLLVLAVILFFSAAVFSQDNAQLLRDANNFELKFDEPGALEKYKQVAANDPSNIKALVKCTEFNCSIGKRQADKNAKATYYTSAQDYAQQAYAKDSTNSDACYAKALVATRMSEIENDNKKLNDYIRQIKIYSDKALATNANNAKANYILGKWHFELIHSNWIKKPAMKNFYDGIYDTQLDSAEYYMEKVRTIDPYFALNYLDLAKVYMYDRQTAKALGVLEKLVKLPNRTFDDPAIKDEGKQLLATIQ
jgi:hypothetical protein